MAYSLTIAGYTFDNPPESYRKHLTLGNSPVPHFNRGLAQFYQSDQQEIQFEVEGRLSLNEQNDLDELERLQQLAIDGGEVKVEFDPFFSGKCIIEDDPFQQSDDLSRYRFIMTVNSVSTDSSAYPAHQTPTTGNTFKLGSFDFGFDPDSVEENYERQTTTVDRLQGISQSTDNAGLVTKVTIDGNTDGGGLAALWDKARNNELSYLEAEFQKGWALIADLSIQNNENAPDYLQGLFRYNLDLLIVSNPEGGIGDVSSFIDHGVKDTGTYVSDNDSGDSDFSGLEFTVENGSGSINGDYVSWPTTTLTLTDDATNWVYVTDDNGDGQGDVKYNNSGFPADGIELYRVYTSGGDIVTIEDVRAQLIKDNDSDAGDSTSETDGSDIYYTVAGGTSPDDPNNQETTWVQTTHKLALNATNYLFVEDPDSDGDGQVAINQSGYPSNTVSLWRVETDSDSITNEIDDRPDDLTEDGSGDTSDSDLLFSDDFVLDDTAFEFARVLALADSFDLGDAGTLPWLGIATLDAESIADIDDSALLPALGLATFTDDVTPEDGGSASQAGRLSTATIGWGDSTDWDNAQSEYGVEHPSGSVSLFKIFDNHDDNSLDTSKWQSGFNGGSAVETNNEIELQPGGGDNDRPFLYTADDIAASGGSSMLIEVDVTQGGDQRRVMPWFNGKVAGTYVTAEYGVGAVGENGVIRVWDPNNDGVSADYGGNATFGAGDTVQVVVEGDHSNFDVTVYVNGSQVEQVTGLSMGWGSGDPHYGSTHGRETGSEFHHDNTTVMALDGFVKTATKSFSEAVTPDLKNLTYTLDGGTITVDVVGSPGTADEERVSQTLDGASSYDLTWNDSHTDFLLEISLSSSAKNDVPSFDGGDLEGEVGSSGDSDQNPNTHWTIFGGQYDTSGNEYEGGGVTTKYAG